MKYALVYDGECQVCNRFVAQLRRWDRRQVIELLPSQAPGVMDRFSWIPPGAFREAIQLVREDGVTWQGAAALEELLGLLPRGRWIAWIFTIPLARMIADRFYRSFARNRYRLGCGLHCNPSSRTK